MNPQLRIPNIIHPSSLRLSIARWHPKTLASFAIVAALLLVGCVPSDLIAVGGASNPNADTTIFPKEGPNGEWGYVDRNGKWLIEPQFLQASGFTDNFFDEHDGEAIVAYGDKVYYIDKSGKFVSEFHSKPRPNP